MTTSISVINENQNEATEKFLLQCKSFIQVDVEKIRDIAFNTIKYLKGDQSVRWQLQAGQELEMHWYESLGRGEPAWAVYSTDYYLAELWSCWSVYSRRYLHTIQSPKSLVTHSIVSDMGNVRRILDLGCGLGYTTAGLKSIFPQAEVYGTEMSGTRQWKFAERMASLNGFTILNSAQGLSEPVDLVFASEYFEHHQRPIAHLREVLRFSKPRVMLVANAFGTKAIGHFDFYDVDGTVLDGKATSLKFNSEMRGNGYVKVQTKLWNNRPAYWKKVG